MNILRTNPNDCKKCQWKRGKNVDNDWCYWYHNEPTNTCLYDRK